MYLQYSRIFILGNNNNSSLKKEKKKLTKFRPLQDFVGALIVLLKANSVDCVSPKFQTHMMIDPLLDPDQLQVH